MKCPKCGSDVSGNFCVNCGNKLIITPSPQTQQPINATPENTRVKKKSKQIVCWIIASVLVVLSLGAVQINVASFILILLSAFIVSPISDNVPFFRDILSRHKPLKIVLPILYCFIAFAIIDDKSETDVPKQTETAIVSTTVTTENTTITTTLHKTTTKKTTTKAVITTAKTADAKTSRKATVATVPTTTTQVVTQPTTEAQIKIIHFILNTDTNCVHILPSCSAAQKIVPENYSVIDIPENQLSNYSGTYWACGMCSSKYRGVLPKD